MTKTTQLLAVLDEDTARQFKAKLALDGITYKDWLRKRIDSYLSIKPAAAKTLGKGRGRK